MPAKGQINYTEWGTCPDNGCDGQVTRRGFCNAHSLRFYKFGDPQWETPLFVARRWPGSGLDVQRDILDHLEVNPYTGCETWPYATYTDGRGHIKEGLVHRIVFEHFNGPVPDGLYVLHSCGKGHLACADYRHLRAGTAQDNSHDAMAHGTTPRGENHSAAKLTDEQADEIRTRALAGENQRMLAEEFGVSRPLISMIKTGKVRRV